MISFLLYIFVALLILLFIYTGGSYLSKIRSSKASLPEKFIFLLSIYFVISIPFSLFEMSLMLLTAIYICLILVFVWFSKDIAIKELLDLKKIKIPNKIDGVVIVAISLMAISLVLSIFLMRPNFDDSQYLSSSAHDQSSQGINSTEQTTGNSSFEIPPHKKIHSWELFIGSISYVGNLQVPSLYHVSMSFVVIVLAYISYFKLLGELTRNKKELWMALIFLVVLFIFSGYSRWSEGALLFGRTWQGKAALLHIVLPIILYNLILYSKKYSAKNIIVILLALIAGLALNPTAIYLGSIPVLIYCLIIFYRRKYRKSISLALTLFPVLLYALITILLIKSSDLAINFESNPVNWTRYKYFVSEINGNSITYILIVCSLVVNYFLSKKNERTFLVFYPLILCATFLNPLISSFVADNITSTATYWRLFWLIPSSVYISVATVKLMSLLSKRYNNLFGYFPIIGCILLIIIFNKNLYTNNGFSKPYSSNKLPPDIELIVDHIVSDESGVVLSGEVPSAYLRSFRKSKFELLWSRTIYMNGFLGVKSEEYKEKKYLYQTIEGIQKYDKKRFNGLIDKYGVKWIVVNKNSTLSGLEIEGCRESEYENKEQSKYILLNCSKMDR